VLASKEQRRTVELNPRTEPFPQPREDRRRTPVSGHGSAKALDEHGIAGTIKISCRLSAGEKAMKKGMITAAVAVSMSAIAPAYAQSVSDCTKGPSENYVKCLEAVVTALRSDLEKYKSDVAHKAFQGDIDQIRNEITSLKKKVNDLEARVGDAERITKGLTAPLRISVGDNCLRVTGDPAIVALGNGCTGQASAFTLQAGKSN
jgi:cell division protein FtsL